ncbi:DUF1934 domain-containing protein [Lacticaseibacillus zhaodongensis]|uniref:DUF1934 domain-containing protein n=1 Tax=Lacticaseibacillus zhaodongensis TaxID=2668065 RepID=UPI0012D2DB7C|nr:DUF1934 domain-containing protein [Lacticaseibacillus zhaodongensis]
MDMSRGVPVQVHVETWVDQDGEKEHHQFDEPGQVVQLGDTWYVRYIEPGDEHLPVTFKIQGTEAVTLIRGSSNNDTHVRLQFIAEKQVTAQYHTPYGVIPVETITPRMDVALNNEPTGGEAYIEYRLSANGQHIGDYRLRLLFNA